MVKIQEENKSPMIATMRPEPQKLETPQPKFRYTSLMQKVESAMQQRKEQESLNSVSESNDDSAENPLVNTFPINVNKQSRRRSCESSQRTPLGPPDFSSVASSKASKELVSCEV